MNDHISNAKLKIIISMAAFGTISIFVKNIALSSREIAFFRALIAFFVLHAYALVSKNLRKKSSQNQIPADSYETSASFCRSGRRLFLLLLSGFAIGLNWIFLFEAYRFVPVSIATLCYYFAPTLVTFFSFLIFHEKLNRRQLLCFVISTLGLILVLNVTGGAVNYTGIFYGLAAAALYAAVVMMNKAIPNIDAVRKTSVQFAGAIVTLLPYILLTGGFHFEDFTAFSLINLLILGIFHTGVCYCLYFSSLKSLTGQQAAIYSYLDPLVAIIISMTVLQETVMPVQLLGGCLILGAAVANEKGC